jgi:hypothetical protein
MVTPQQGFSWILRNKKPVIPEQEISTGYLGTRDSDEEYVLLDCNGIYFGKIPTFPRNLRPPSSESGSKPSKKPARSRRQTTLLLLPGFLLGLLSDPEDGGDMFLQNARLSPNYTALQPRRTSIHTHRCENLRSTKRVNWLLCNKKSLSNKRLDTCELQSSCHCVRLSHSLSIGMPLWDRSVRYWTSAHKKHVQSRPPAPRASHKPYDYVP